MIKEAMTVIVKHTGPDHQITAQDLTTEPPADCRGRNLHQSIDLALDSELFTLPGETEIQIERLYTSN